MRKNDQRLALRLSAEDKRFLQQQARRKKMSVSRLVRQVLTQVNPAPNED